MVGRSGQALPSGADVYKRQGIRNGGLDVLKTAAVFESVPDRLLLLGGQGGLFGIQHPALPAVRVLHRVVDTDIT